MSEKINDISVIRKFMVVKIFKKHENTWKRTDVKRKIDEIILTYHNHMPSIVNYKNNIHVIAEELLNRCYSKNNTIYWDYNLRDQLLNNFEQSIASTFNIEDRAIKKIMNDYNCAFDDRYNYLIDSMYFLKKENGDY